MKKLTAILMSVMMFMVMALPGYAVNGDGFVSSVTGEPAPGIVTNGDVIGFVVDENGDVIDEVKTGDIVITPVSDKDSLPDDAKKDLEDAYDKIENDEMEYPQELIEALGGQPVAKELFDLSIIDEDIQKYLDEGNSIKLTLDTKLPADENVMVAAYVDGQWVLASECVVNEDGTLTFVMDKFCPVAIFVKGADLPVSGEGDGDCKICHTFFPYLGRAWIFPNTIFNGVCTICFLLVMTAVTVVSYLLYRLFKKKDKEEK